MRDSVKRWFAFAEENLACARIVADKGYYNPALQNVQQAVEKTLKALILQNDLEFRKTHNIQELRGILAAAGLDIELTDEECELLDSIYLPSKYPLGSALPDAQPDQGICKECIAIAAKVLSRARQLGL